MGAGQARRPAAPPPRRPAASPPRRPAAPRLSDGCLWPRSLLHEIALKGPTVELIPDAAGWLPRCRAMLSSTGAPQPPSMLDDRYLPSLLAIAAPCRAEPPLVAGMVPLWCLLPLSWAVTIGLVTWVVGCACLHRRISSRHGGVHGGKRLEYTGAPSLPVSPLLSPSRAELSYFDAR